jgi:hypothetical protein
VNSENLNNLITEALAIEARDVKEAGALGFMARALVQATLPHSKVNGNEFRRTNGLFNLTLLADSKIGLPYGVTPRLLLAWISTEAVRTKNRHLVLGRTLANFMEELDLIPSGGRWGTITRLKDQMQRLFASSISCTYDDGKNWAIRNINPISKADLWWDPKNPNQATLFESTLTLNEDFFNEIVSHPIPIDIRALKALKRSPLALDIYCWLTYRNSYLKKLIVIPWQMLQIQFGSSYATDQQGTRNFKKAFLREFKKVSLIYPKTNLEFLEEGLKLKPSQTHVGLLTTL